MLELIWAILMFIIQTLVPLAIAVLIVVLAFAIGPLEGWITVFIMVIALVTGFLVHWRLEKNKKNKK